MLNVENVSLHYGAAQALRDVSFKAEMGKITCVLGRNGVGKSSLLRAVTGQHAVTSGTISFNEDESPFMWVDLFGAGPSTVISWTSSYSETGVLGEAELATAEKGQRAYEEAVKQLVRFVSWWKPRPKDQRRDRHRQPPTMPIPWGQRPVQ